MRNVVQCIIANCNTNLYDPVIDRRGVDQVYLRELSKHRLHPICYSAIANNKDWIAEIGDK